MTLLPFATPRATLSPHSEGRAYGQQLKAKSYRVGSFSQVYQRSVMWQSPGKFVKPIRSIGSIRFCLPIAYPKGLQRSSIWFRLVSGLRNLTTVTKSNKCAKILVITMEFEYNYES